MPTATTTPPTIKQLPILHIAFLLRWLTSPCQPGAHMLISPLLPLFACLLRVFRNVFLSTSLLTKTLQYVHKWSGNTGSHSSNVKTSSSHMMPVIYTILPPPPKNATVNTSLAINTLLLVEMKDMLKEYHSLYTKSYGHASTLTLLIQAPNHLSSYLQPISSFLDFVKPFHAFLS
jgi:hypothetical protein